MNLTLSAYVPALGQQDILDKCIGLLHRNAIDEHTQLYVIDNASQRKLESTFAYVIRNEENRGMVGSLKQAMEHSQADIVVFLHSDMYVYEDGWDIQILKAFEDDPKLGMLGVVGAEIADANGGRSRVHCAFRDWVSHGHKPTKKITPVAILDGCLLAARRSMMEGLSLPEVYGDGNEYFFYDKELSLTVTMESWHVAVINMDCEHLGGRTSCSEEFTAKINAALTNHDTMYARSEKRYLDKWRGSLPVRVTPEYVVHAGRPI